jgi:hypothetical protein
VQQELSKSLCEFDIGEDHTSGVSDFSNAFADFLEGALFGSGVGIECPEIQN